MIDHQEAENWLVLSLGFVFICIHSKSTWRYVVGAYCFRGVIEALDDVYVHCILIALCIALGMSLDRLGLTLYFAI